MMSAQTFDWSIGAQARRVCATDTRVTGIDMIYSLFYVLAMFFLAAPHPQRAVYVAVAPFIALLFILFYLVGRVCFPDCEKKTATFYANLPRHRSVTFWTHALWLGVFALALEMVIAVAVEMRLNAARPDQPFVLAPYMFVLPFFGIAFLMWLGYGGVKRVASVPVSIATALSLMALIIWDIELRDGKNERFTVTAMQDFGPAFGLALLAGLLLWHGHLRWKKTQLGEVA
jgi:hypothetical protein